MHAATLRRKIAQLLPDKDAIRWMIWSEFQSLDANPNKNEHGQIILPEGLHEIAVAAVGDYGFWCRQTSGAYCGDRRCDADHTRSGWYYEDEWWGPWMDWHSNGRPSQEVPYADDENPRGNYRMWDYDGVILVEVKDGTYAEFMAKVSDHAARLALAEN